MEGYAKSVVLLKTHHLVKKLLGIRVQRYIATQVELILKKVRLLGIRVIRGIWAVQSTGIGKVV